MNEKSKKKLKALRHNPLGDDIEDMRRTTVTGERGTRRKLRRDEASSKAPRRGGGEGEDVLPSDLSRKVLALARRQQREEAIDTADADADDTSRRAERIDVNSQPRALLAINRGTRIVGDDDDDDGDEDAGNDGDDVAATRGVRTTKVLRDGKGRPVDFSSDEEGGDGEGDGGEDNTTDAGDIVTDGADFELDADDERALAMFMPRALRAKQTLADIIMAKIRESEGTTGGGGGGGGAVDVDDSLQRRLNPAVYKVYRGVGTFLQTYRAGKLPKAFKVVPRLTNWEEVLWVMQPHLWSDHAMWAATRLFASNLDAKMAQRYFALLLLPKIREQIAQKHKLSVHLYQALRKATYKPGAFFKGVVLPLCEVRRASLPVLHSAACLMKLAGMPYTTASAVFLKTLLDKKYALPYKTIDELYSHFMSFVRDERRMPVLWHQTLLVFAQRYKTDLEVEQKEGLKVLLRKHVHRAITPEIRRELFTSQCRHNAAPVGDGEPTTAAQQYVATFFQGGGGENGENDNAQMGE